MSAKISYRSVTRQSKESAGLTINFPVPKALCPCDPPSTFCKSSWKVRAGETVVNETKVQPFFPEETRKRRALACLIWSGIAYSDRKLGPRPGRQRSLKRWVRTGDPQLRKRTVTFARRRVPQVPKPYAKSQTKYVGKAPRQRRLSGHVTRRERRWLLPLQDGVLAAIGAGSLPSPGRKEGSGPAIAALFLPLLQRVAVAGMCVSRGNAVVWWRVCMCWGRRGEGFALVTATGGKSFS